MEENILEEQPFENGSSATEQIESEAEQSEAERGVPIGKFKNVDDLYQAYNNLQSEFTKKCQRLSELEKDKVNLEQIRKEKFENDFKSFLLENREAASYAQEIKSKVLSSEQLMSQDKPFDVVWREMILEKLSSQDKSKDPLVRDFILNDEQLKNYVIENYVKEVSKNRAPALMTSSSGEKVTKTAIQKPDSFEQAKKIVLDLLSWVKGEK